MVRSSASHRSDFSFANDSSIGLRSGLYGGKKPSVSPSDSIAICSSSRVRTARDAPVFAKGTATVSTGHVGTGPGLVQEHTPLRCISRISARQTVRCDATSGRSYSAALRTFFQRKTKRLRPTPNSRNADANWTLCLEFFQCDVRRLEYDFGKFSACSRHFAGDRNAASWARSSRSFVALFQPPDLRLAHPILRGDLDCSHPGITIRKHPLAPLLSISSHGKSSLMTCLPLLYNTYIIIFRIGLAPTPRVKKRTPQPIRWSILPNPHKRALSPTISTGSSAQNSSSMPGVLRATTDIVECSRKTRDV